MAVWSRYDELTTDDLALADEARRAVVAFRAMLPTLNGYARALTGNPKVTIVISADSPHTDGTRIYMRPPIALGRYARHDRTQCDKRDSQGDLICQACFKREEVNILIYHEVSHICFDSFAPIKDKDKKLAIEEAVKQSGTKFGKAVAERISETKGDGSSGWDLAEISNLISPFHFPILNGLEDARVNNEMFKARAGTRVMFDSLIKRVMRNGVPKADGTTEYWSDRPLNAQVVCAVYMKAANYDLTECFSDEILEALADQKLTDLITEGIKDAESASAIFNLSFPVLERLRELGFCRMPDEPEEEEEQDESETGDGDSEDSGDGDSQDGESDSNSAGSGNGDSEDETSDNSANQDGEPEENSGSSGGSSDQEEDGDKSDKPDSESGNSDDSDVQDGSGSDDGHEESDSESGSDPAGPETGSPADSSADDSDSEGESNGSESSDSSDDNLDSDYSPENTGSGDISEGPDPEGDSEESDPGQSSGGQGSGSANTGNQDSSEGGGEAAESDSEVSGDSSEPTQAGNSPANLPEQLAGKSEEEMGTLEDVVEALKAILGHGDEHDPLKGDGFTEAEEAAVVVAIIQGMYFEKPSREVYGVRVHRKNKHVTTIGHQGNEVDMATAWTHNYGDRGWGRSSKSQFEELDVPESILGPALLRMRVAFADNARAAEMRNQKSGRVNGRVLGRRVHFDDPRLFKKKLLPGRRDYAVVIGIDVSGSTVGQNIALAKRAAYAQAELCERTGVKFAVYAHSAKDYGHRTEAYALDIYEIKSFDEPWGPDQRKHLRILDADSDNLDGHTLEFYRKRLDERSETDKILMYYTDGKFPAANHDEELEIIRHELPLMKKKGYTLMAVGIRTDSPIAHGFDTATVYEDEDLVGVVKLLEKRLSVRRGVSL